MYYYISFLKLESCFKFMDKLNTLLQKSEEKDRKKSAGKWSKIPRKKIKKLDRNYFICNK